MLFIAAVLCRSPDKMLMLRLQTPHRLQLGTAQLRAVQLTQSVRAWCQGLAVCA